MKAQTIETILFASLITTVLLSFSIAGVKAHGTKKSEAVHIELPDDIQ